MIFKRTETTAAPGTEPQPIQPHSFPRRDISAPMPEDYSPPSVRSRRRSEAAASVAEQWEALETELSQKIDENNSLRAQLQTCEECNSALNEDIKRLRTENAELNRENAEIFTRLDISAGIILAIRRRDPRLDAAIKAAAEKIESVAQEIPPEKEEPNA